MWQTRLLAVECVRRLLVVLQHPHHFDLQAARASGDLTERYLIEQLQELVSVAFTAATSPFEAVRPAGVVALFDIADKFGPAEDPDYEGKRLIELYAAQISAALRPCFAVEAEPSLAAAGCATTSRYLLEVGSSARNHQVEFSPPTAPLQPLHLHLVQAASLVCPLAFRWTTSLCGSCSGCCSSLRLPPSSVLSSTLRTPSLRRRWSEQQRCRRRLS